MEFPRGDLICAEGIGTVELDEDALNLREGLKGKASCASSKS